MQPQQITIALPSPTATAHLARTIGATLEPGDVVLLEGSIGAGKTHFARALIQSILDTPEDVPSPTFTIVQVYDTQRGELWHADLYRLTSTFELEELGLSQAFEDAICLVEWPDRLGEETPQTALRLCLETGPDEDARVLTATWTHPRWTKMMKDIIND